MKLHLLVLLLLAGLLGSSHGQVPGIIDYQGGVAVGGTNYNGVGHFKFAFVSPDGSQTFWSNDNTSTAGSQPQEGLAIQVVDGRYAVTLGDTTLANMVAVPAAVFANSNVHLRAWFSDGTAPFQRVEPDQAVAAVGYALMAANVADGSITSAKLAPNAVTALNIAPGSIGAAQLARSAVGPAQLAPNAVGPAQLAAGAAAANLNASGGLLLSDQPNATNLLQAGFQQIGTVMAGADQWQSVSQFIPAPQAYHLAVWTGTEMIIWSSAPARYNPVTDSWRGMAQAGTTGGLRALWTGNEMIALGTVGTAYNPITDRWRNLPRAGFPTGLSNAAALWTGKEILVWGATGGNRRCDPASDNRWRPLSDLQAPSRRTAYSAVWTGKEMIIWGGIASNQSFGTGARYNPMTDTWTTLSAADAPSARRGHAAIWTGKEMLVWGGVTTGDRANGAAYDPATDRWRTISAKGQPSPRAGHVAFWTGTEMIVWGGQTYTDSVQTQLNSGARYNPSTDSWQAIPMSGAAEALLGSSAVWTGSEMIIWGGRAGVDSRSALSSGGARYNPVQDTWFPVASTPAGRVGHSVVWTGSEMIIWGGSSGARERPLPGALQMGGRFNPVTRHWLALPLLNGPTLRMNHRAVWTGNEMIVWGGDGYDASGFYVGGLNTGSRYNPRTDTWKPMRAEVAPAGRFGHSMLWTGTEAIVFGGRTQNLPTTSGYLGNGARYNPQIDSWGAIANLGAPSPRSLHAAVWTGREMIIWGGQGPAALSSAKLLNTGARYNPGSDTWRPMTTNGAPQIALIGGAVWTGRELIVVPADPALAAGGRYDPETDRWTTFSSVGMASTSVRGDLGDIPLTTVWTGQEVLVWGDTSPATGARYNPLTDTWTPMTNVSVPPNRRGHWAVWTGDAMLIFGGTLSPFGGRPDPTLLYTLTRPIYLYRHR